MSVIAVIPARSGSKGVPDKNIRALAGHPLLAYSIVAASLARTIDRVIVSTDSPGYRDIALSYGAEVPFLRPAELASDGSTDLEFMRHTIEWFLREEQSCPELLIHLRPTTPYRDPLVVDQAVAHLAAEESATALRSVQEMSESAYKSFELRAGYLAAIGSESTDLDNANAPRQDFATTYLANGYVDIIRSQFVIDEGKIHGNRVIGFATEPVTEVDNEEDLKYLEYQATHHPLLVERLFPRGA